MQEPYSEGVAIHTGPESCARRREAIGEALTGESADQVWNCEIVEYGAPTRSWQAEGETEVSGSAS